MDFFFIKHTTFFLPSFNLTLFVFIAINIPFYVPIPKCKEKGLFPLVMCKCTI